LREVNIVQKTGVLTIDYCKVSKVLLELDVMEKDLDINKIVKQHIEMEQFFTGFSLKCRSDTLETQNQEAIMAVAEKTAELEKIAGEVRECRKCELGSLRTNTVPGEGNPNARIMFIGEAPGADEDAQGRPFVGRAGQLLDKIIQACGLKRSDVFIGNILKCRPPENRDPRAEEIICCLPYLQRQIEIIDPEIIVALGAHAARTLLNTTKPIGQLRGQFHEYYAGIGRPPVKLMATYHTAYLLRNYSPENRRRVWEDMKKVLAELGLPIPK
jgi:uracil-DNA glycosylase family 4